MPCSIAKVMISYTRSTDDHALVHASVVLVEKAAFGLFFFVRSTSVTWRARVTLRHGL